MTNVDFVEILGKGVEIWNIWRILTIIKSINLDYLQLINMDFSGIDFSDVWLSKTNLSGSNLSQANLLRAKMAKTNISGTNFSGAVLRRANLYYTNAICTDFRNSDLQEAKMIGCNLKGANITGAKLYGTTRDNWNIEGIKCDYVFWDPEGGIRTPKDRDFKPGEFEELYKKVYEIEHIFENGFSPLDAVLMNQIVQAINKKHPEFELKLDSLHSRGQPRAVFTVLHKDYAEVALQEIKFDYEKRIAVLEADRDRLEQCFNKAIDQPKIAIRKLEMGDEYIIKGQAGAVGPGAKAEGNVFNQIWNKQAKDIDLKKLSEELSILRKKLKENDEPESDIAVGHIAAAEIEAKKGNGPKVLEHLKSSGQWTFNAATQVGCAFVAEIMKKHLL